MDYYSEKNDTDYLIFLFYLIKILKFKYFSLKMSKTSETREIRETLRTIDWPSIKYGTTIEIINKNGSLIKTGSVIEVKRARMHSDHIVNGMYPSQIYFYDESFIDICDDRYAHSHYVIITSEGSGKILINDDGKNTTLCIYGESSVILEDSTKKLVKDLRPGDKVKNSEQSIVTIKYILESGTSSVYFVDGGAYLTSYHPYINNDGLWTFPINENLSEVLYGQVVYSIVLCEENISKILVNNTYVSVIGHGIENIEEYPVIGHPFYGNRAKVISSIKKCEIIDGVSIISKVHRCPITGLVNSFN